MTVWGVWMWILCGGSLLASAFCSGTIIRGCEHGRVDAVEGTDPIFTCGEYWTQGPNWTVYDDEGQDVYSGSCSWETCTPWDKQFQLNKVYLKQHYMYTSRLTIKNIRRDSASKVVCSDSSGRASCKLKIIVPVSIVPRTCSVQLSRWKVYGVCTIQWLDTISDTSKCRWRFRYQSFPWTTPVDLKVLLSSSSFVSDDSVGYNKRNCSFEQEMPVIEGDYSYSIRVSSHPDDQFSKSLRIEKPAPPQHNCTKMLLEGSNTTCTCFTLNRGSPPAQIGWAESSKENLVIEGITREGNGTVTTCNLTWGSIHYTTTYTMNVAFGPSVAYISSTEKTFGDETKTVLVCTAIDVYPSALFRWNISCENETNNETTSRCTLSTAVLADQMAIECTASNQIFVEKSSTSIYVVKPKHNPFQWGIIAGSAAALLVLVVIVAAIIVGIKRRKERISVIIKSKTQTPIVRFAASSGDVYTIAGTTTVDPREHEYVELPDRTYLNTIPQTQTPVVRFTAPSEDLYSVADLETAREVNQVDNKLETQRPAAHFAAPSGDLYAIACPTTAGADKHVTEATNTTWYAPTSSSDHEARDDAHTTNQGIQLKKMAVKPKRTRFGKRRQDLPVIGYMNVTEVLSNSELRVFPKATISKTGSSDLRARDTSTISDDEYIVLRSQGHRTGQEDHVATYSNCNIK